jgi:hypothetical protein
VRTRGSQLGESCRVHGSHVTAGLGQSCSSVTRGGHAFFGGPGSCCPVTRSHSMRHQCKDKVWPKRPGRGGRQKEARKMDASRIRGTPRRSQGLLSEDAALRRCSAAAALGQTPREQGHARPPACDSRVHPECEGSRPPCATAKSRRTLGTPPPSPRS